MVNIIKLYGWIKTELCLPRVYHNNSWFSMVKAFSLDQGKFVKFVVYNS